MQHSSSILAIMLGVKRLLSRDSLLTYLAMSVILCAGLLSCRHAGPNTVVVYLEGADQQWETQEQGREIEKALNDMLTLSPDELRNRRYANYQMQPGAWTIIDILHKYFLPRGSADVDESRFTQTLQTPQPRR